MAFLADLGHFQQDVAASKQRAYGQRRKINAFGDDILAEIAVRYRRAAAAEFFYFFQRQQTYLTVPRAAVGVAFNPPIHKTTDKGLRPLLRPLDLARTNSSYNSHTSLQFHS